MENLRFGCKFVKIKLSYEKVFLRFINNLRTNNDKL